MRLIQAAIIACALALGGCASMQAGATPAMVSAQSPHIQAAIADPRRPEEERVRDAARKPDEMLAFAGIDAGEVVVDLLPGAGYFTRLFSVAVGPEGRVFTVYPAQAEGRMAERIQSFETAMAAYANVTSTRQGFDAMTFPAPVDVVWTAQNYHDLYLRGGSPAGANRAIFAALKPGGLYVIVDHSALAGAEVGPTANTLHRIDQAAVRREVEAAGFVFDGASEVLRNPADARTLNVFDPSLRGHTDQFVMRFRKPG